MPLLPGCWDQRCATLVSPETLSGPSSSGSWPVLPLLSSDVAAPRSAPPWMHFRSSCSVSPPPSIIFSVRQDVFMTCVGGGGAQWWKCGNSWCKFCWDADSFRPPRTACEGTGVGRPRLCWLYLERRDGLRARGWRSVFSPHGWNKRWTSGLCFGGGLEERGRQARDPPCQGSISVHCPLQLWSVPWLNPPIQARLSASAKPCPHQCCAQAAAASARRCSLLEAPSCLPL